MKTVIAVLIATTLCAAPLPVQIPPALTDFLKSQPPTRSTSRSVEYRVAFKSFNNGKQRDAFQDSGVMHIGTTDEGEAWVSSPIKSQALLLGESTPLTDGQGWFKQFCNSSRLAPLADPTSLLRKLVHDLPLKVVESPLGGLDGPVDQILVYRLEAPRPDAKLMTYKAKAGEARLQVRKDGIPVKLEIVQVYEGELSPHFGRYSLNRKETWTFSVDAGQIHTKTYRLSLRRQDWKESIEANVEMAVGGLQ